MANRFNQYGLTPAQETFATEIASGASQSDAYRKAYPKSLKWKDAVVWAAASKLASNSKVCIRVKELQEKACIKNEITVEKVLQRYWEMATANSNDLMQYRRECCRYCFGTNHAYQWIDEAEFFEAEELRQKEIDQAEAASKRKRGNHAHHGLKPVTNDGGYGFSPHLRPHPKCPRCHGDGIERIYINDTRDLSGGALMLYAGIKQSAQGLEVKLHSQIEALGKIAAWVGIDKKTFANDKDNPLIPKQEAVTRVVIVPAKVPAIIETKPIPPQDEMDEEQ